MVAIQPFVGEKPASPPKYGGAEKCQACGKSVYANEKVVAAKFVYHIGCLKCAQCNMRLQAASVFWIASGAEIQGTADEMRCPCSWSQARGPRPAGRGLDSRALWFGCGLRPWMPREHRTPAQADRTTSRTRTSTAGATR